DGDERPVHHTADMRGKAETWVRERLDESAAQECQQDDDDPVPYEPPLRIEHGRAHSTVRQRRNPRGLPAGASSSAAGPRHLLTPVVAARSRPPTRLPEQAEDRLFEMNTLTGGLEAVLDPGAIRVRGRIWRMDDPCASLSTVTPPCLLHFRVS